jgi:L-2-hydroxyglutarate oxidase LhgO
VTAPGLGRAGRGGLHRGLSGRRASRRAHYGKGLLLRPDRAGAVQPLIYPPPISGRSGTHYRRDLSGGRVSGRISSTSRRRITRVDEDRAEGFYAYIRRFWPALPDGRAAPDYAGIRPKLHGAGEPQPDFMIDGTGDHGIEGLVCLFGIESPGLTSSLALGAEVSARLP